MEALFDGRVLCAGLFVESLSTLLVTFGAIATISAPRGTKTGILIAAGVAAIPGLWILTGGARISAPVSCLDARPASQP